MKKSWGIGIILIYLLFQIAVLPFVGFTWDEPSIYFIGKRNRDFWQTFRPGKIPDYSPAVKVSDGQLRYVWGARYYPPFVPTLASFTSLIFSETFNIAGFITGHHLALILLGAVGVFSIYGIGLLIGFSPLLATGVALSYGLYPTIMGQMRNDAKDVPVAGAISFFIFCILKLLQAWRKKHQQFTWTIFSSIALGFALLVKLTAAIMVPIVAIFFGLALLFPKFRKQLPSLPLLVLTPILIALLTTVMVVLFWPWLWDEPLVKLTAMLDFFKSVGLYVPVLYFGTMYQAGVNFPWHYALGILLIQTPPEILLLGMIGVVGVLWTVIKTRNPLPLLFIIWFVLGIGRFFVPGFIIYAKMRHLIDIVPALFILMGYGINFLGNVHTIGRVWKIILVGVIVHELIILVQFFPYEPSYFNSFIGGTKIVAEKKLFDVEYWGSAVKEGMEYIAKQEPTAPVVVYTCSMAHLGKYYQTKNVTVSKIAAGADYLILPNSASFFGVIYDQMNPKDIVYTVKRAGAELLYVFKKGSSPIPQCGGESEDL